MGKNKNAIIRYRVLDKCFSNTGRRYTVNDLLEECNKALREENSKAGGIQKRQLYDDISFMESDIGYGIELTKTKEGKEVYYRYADTKFSINQKGLNEAEITKIGAALAVLSRFKGKPQFEWIEEVVTKFESKLGIRKGTEKIVGFDENLDYTAVKNIAPLFDAIHNQNPVKICYRNFKNEKSYDIQFHPYYLKEYNKRWFCLGLNEKAAAISTLALDRIISINEIKNKYIPNQQIDFNEYFEEVIGVTVEGDMKKVILQVDNSLWPYIETKPLHGSQKKIKKGKDHVTISIEVKLNYELESLILSHGEKMKVEAPEDFRNKIQSRIKLMQ